MSEDNKKYKLLTLLKNKIMEITEIEYLQALNIVQEYTKQVNIKTNKILEATLATKTPRQIRDSNLIYHFSIPIALFNILWYHFENIRLCDISKKDFLKVRLAGPKRWNELCNYTGKS